MESLHGFFDRDVFVEAVDLEEVEVGGVEAFEGGFDVGEDGVAGETLRWKVRGCVTVTKGRKEER